VAAQHLEPAAALQPARRPHLMRWRLKTLLATVATLLLAALFLWPFLAILGQSLNRLDVRMNSLSPLPAAFTFERYTMIVTRYHLQGFVLNTFTVVLISTMLSTFASALGGYALAKLPFRGRGLVFLLILAIMLLPTDSMLVPRFIVMRQLHLVNNFWGLILPSVGGGAFGIFLMRQFMLQVPTEMLEAGRIDGCSELGIFTQLVLPNMLAPISVLAVLSVNGGWNSVLWPQILLSDEAKQLIMPAIMRLNTSTGGDPYAREVVTSAALACSIVPITFYLYIQKFFTRALVDAIRG